MRTAGQIVLVFSTLLAAIFVAVQAFYARTALVNAQSNRLLESRVAACFDNFDAAVALDSELRLLAPGANSEANWPPMLVIASPDQVLALQRRVLPLLDALEASLVKASILGPLDRYRAYLSGRINGLGPRLLMLDPQSIAAPQMHGEAVAVLARLSDFLGAQYQISEGCRTIAGG